MNMAHIDLVVQLRQKVMLTFASSLPPVGVELAVMQMQYGQNNRGV